MTNKGYSLIEIIIYTAILAAFTVVMVNMLVRISGSRERLTAAQRVSNSAITALDRMSREINKASSINTASSTLGSSPGKLIVSGTESGTAYTIEFYVASSTLRMKENNMDVGPLTESGVRVTNLIFRRIASSTDQAIKIDLGLESGTTSSYKSETFYTTVLLRQSL